MLNELHKKRLLQFPLKLMYEFFRGATAEELQTLLTYLMVTLFVDVQTLLNARLAITTKITVRTFSCHLSKEYLSNTVCEHMLKSTLLYFQHLLKFEFSVYPIKMRFKILTGENESRRSRKQIKTMALWLENGLINQNECNNLLFFSIISGIKFWFWWTIIQANMRFGACELPEASIAAPATFSAAAKNQSSSAESNCRSAWFGTLLAAVILLSIQKFHV